MGAAVKPTNTIFNTVAEYRQVSFSLCLRSALLLLFALFRSSKIKTVVAVEARKRREP